ncbi:hypothetical protein [uncultured Clostridium sp.]|uniref:hypothetical protein n=1 Tax=uncultured Clostridium sp. TaxID=59620 RepID=UPI00262205C7|nr:hypothetical protein [uncultured Clostridium sp.]
MPIVIGNNIIRTKSDYLTHQRKLVNTSMRADLKKDLVDLCSDLDKPLSKGLDCLVLLLESDQEIADKFIDILLRY